MTLTFEPGQYRGRVTRWALVKAKNEKKTPQFALTVLALGKINPHDPEGPLDPCPELERTIFRSITEKTAKWLLQDLKAIFDYPHESFAQLDPEHAEAFDFMNLELSVALSFEEYDGKTREKWNFASGLPYGGDPMTTDEVKKLDSLFGIAKPKKHAKKSKELAPAPSADGQPAAPEAVPV